MSMTKLILLIIVINIVGSLLKKMQAKKRAREKMEGWEREEAAHPQAEPQEAMEAVQPDDEPPPPRHMAEPDEILADFFARLQGKEQVPAEPEPVLPPSPVERPMVTGPFTQGSMMNREALLDSKKDYETRSIFEGKATLFDTPSMLDKASILEKEGLLDHKRTRIRNGEESGNAPSVIPVGTATERRYLKAGELKRAVLMAEILGPPRALSPINYS
ncbi:MAG: hypothetical protein V1913_11145 [Fibrobacterota bacterium]